MGRRIQASPPHAEPRATGAIRRAAGLFESRLRRLGRRVPRRVYYYNDISIWRATRLRPTDKLMPDMHFRWASRDDEADLQIIRPRPDGYTKRFAIGWRCVIGHHRDEPASVFWVDSRTWHHSLSNAFRIQVGTTGCWTGFGIVRPQFRGTGVVWQHWQAVMNLLASEGTDTFYLSIHRRNLRSRRAHLRMGFQELNRYRVLRLCGLTYHKVDRSASENAFPASSGWGMWIGAQTRAEEAPPI